MARKRAALARAEIARKGRPPDKLPTKDGKEYLYALGPVAADRIRIERERDRLKKRMLRLRGYNLPSKMAVDELVKALDCLDRVIDLLRAVPEDWRPPRGSLAGNVMEKGATVTIRPAFLERYKGIIDNPKRPMRVEKVVGARVVIMVSDTMCMPVSRMHVHVMEKGP
jgi:hypothetical protein